MALQFNPPEWIIQSYLNRKQPTEIANEGIGTAIQAYASTKAQDPSKIQAYIKAFEAGGPQLASEVARRTGLKNPPSLPGQMPNQRGPMETAGVTPPSQESPIIQAWNSNQGGQQSPETLLGMGAYGKKQLQDMKLVRDLQTDPNAPVPTMTTEEALKAGSVPPRTKVLDTAREDYYKERAGDVTDQQQERDYKRKERRSKEKIDLLTRFNADPSVKKAQQSIDAANTIRGLVDSDNPIAAAAVPTFMARASGEVGNLSEADKRPFGGSRAIMTQLEQAVKEATTGKLSESNARFVRQLADIMETRSASNIDNLAKTRSKQYSRASEFIEESDVYQTLRPESIGMGNSSGESPEQRKARLIAELQGAQ